MNRGYPTNLTDNQWQILQKIPATRKRKYSLRDIMDCILYINKFPRLRKILADGGYRGDKLKEFVRKMLGCQLEVVLRPEQSPKSSVSSL